MASIQQNLERRLVGFHDPRQRRGLELLLSAQMDGPVSQALTNSTLVINGGGLTIPKTGAADSYFVVDGSLVKVAAGTAMTGLCTGFNVGAGKFGVCLFLVDAAGALTSIYSDGTAASIAAIIWPAIPTGKACVGFIIVTYASAFTGGTTPLDTATTVYISPTGDFNPGLITTL
jgi:hypothetical protein